MPRNFDTAVVTIGIDPGKNTLHLVGLDARGESCQWGNRCALQEHGTLSALDDNTGHRPDHLDIGPLIRSPCRHWRSTLRVFRGQAPSPP